MESDSKINLIKTINKEQLFNLYKEISNKISDDTYYKLLKDKGNNDQEKENNENMIQIIKQLKENINKYIVDISLYKELGEEIEIKNKNYVLMKQDDNYFIFKGYPSGNLLFLLINNILLSFLNKYFCFKFYFMEAFNKSEIDSITQLNEKIINKKNIDNPNYITKH